MKKGLLVVLGIMVLSGMVFAGGSGEDGAVEEYWDDEMQDSSRRGEFRGYGPRWRGMAKFELDFIDLPAGIVVTEVIQDSPAMQAGLVRGDVIQKVDGIELGSMKDLFEILETKEAGQELQLEVLHGDEQKFVSLTIETRLNKPLIGILSAPHRGLMGEEPLAWELMNVVDDAVIVKSVIEGSPADQSGLKDGDMITAVNGEPVSAREFIELIWSLNPGESVEINYIPLAELKDEFEAEFSEREEALEDEMIVYLEEFFAYAKDSEATVTLVISEEEGKPYIGLEIARLFGHRRGPGPRALGREMGQLPGGF
jgi:membrane-associated protease RseP (regulator of RpoE activity)